MPFFSSIKLWKRWLHQPLTRALAHESSVDPRMSPYGRQWAQITKALGFKEKEAAADFPLDVDSLVARAAGLSLRLTFVSFIAFHSRIAKMSGPVLGPGDGPILGPPHMVFYCGVLFGGSKLRSDSFSIGWTGLPSRRSCKVMSCYG